MIGDFILLVGILGIFAIAINFILEATNKLSKDHKNFGWINLYGSTSLLIYSWYNKVWLFVILNGFLVIVGIYGLYIIYMKNKKNKK